MTNGGLRRRHEDMLRDQEAWFRALRDDAADGTGAVAEHGPAASATDRPGRKGGTLDGEDMWWDRATAMLAGVMRAVAHMREHGDHG